jgi:hypothetical protein
VKGGKGGGDVVAEGAERLAALEAQARQLLRGLPPGGARFAALVEHVLDREKNWVSTPARLPRPLQPSARCSGHEVEPGQALSGFSPWPAAPLSWWPLPPLLFGRL